MASDILGQTFTVSKLPYTSLTDVSLNIKKRKERLVYSAQTTPDNINLAFLKGNEINSDRNLFLSDHSSKLAGNKVSNPSPTLFTAASYTVEVNQFLLTDEFTTPTPSLEKTPLFFKHLIDVSRYTPGSDSILSFQILDTDFNVIEQISELIVKSTYHDGTQYGAAFNNLQNSFDSKTGEVNVYYAKYTIKRGSAITTYVELLNNKPVYREATYDDIDIDNTIKTNRKVYIIEESGTGTFVITMANSSTYALFQNLKTRISLSKPFTKSAQEDWFLTVTAGQFFAKKFNDSLIVKYGIAEYLSQLFSPYAPYKTVVKEEPLSLGGNLYKVSNNIVIDTVRGLDITVELVDSSETVISTLTRADGIRSIDIQNGFIDLSKNVPSSLSPRVSYVYEEKNFEITELDFNPANNVNVSSESVVIYVVPQTSTRERTLFYLRVNAAGKVVYSSEAAYGDDYGSSLATRITAGLSYSDFLNIYTVETTLATSDPLWTANPGFLVLAEVTVGDSISPEDIDVIDIRQRGGGIKNLTRTEILSKNFESIWNWDIGSWDGVGFPGTCSYLIEIPADLLKVNGGSLEPAQFRPIVEEHTALGTYPIIKSYSNDPVITSTVIGTTQVDLTWTYHGPNVSYNVYKATSSEGPFTKVNGSPLGGTSYSVTGLTSQTDYWFFVSDIEDGHEAISSDRRYTVAVETR